MPDQARVLLSGRGPNALYGVDWPRDVEEEEAMYESARRLMTEDVI